MPFDAAQSSIGTDIRTEHLWISPVSPDAVEKHKAEMIEAFKRESPYNARLVSGDMAKWRTLHIRRDELFKTLMRPSVIETRSAAPAKLIRLAETVTRRSASAAFSMEYFDRDPILNVTIGGETACLGIWDGDRLIALAGLNGNPPYYDTPLPWYNRAIVRTLDFLRRGR